MVRRGIVILLLVALGACSKERGTYRGVVVLDRSTARPIVATWATSKATESTDPGDPLADLYGPTDIAIGPGDSIFVGDHGSRRIVVYAPNGKPIRTIGRRGQGPGEFDSIFSLTVDREGRIWVGEMGRLQVLTPSGLCLATTNEIRLMPHEQVLRALPDGRVWVGDPARQACRLVSDGDNWVIGVADSIVGIRSGNRVRGDIRLWANDLTAQLVPALGGSYWCFLPVISGRKPFAWLQEFDRRGVLVADYDLEPALEDSMLTIDKEGLDPAQGVFLTVLHNMDVDQGGRPLFLSVRAPWLCRFDPVRRALGGVREIRIRSEGGTLEPLLVATSMAVDSRGRVAIVGMAQSQKWVVLLVSEEGGGSA